MFIFAVRSGSRAFGSLRCEGPRSFACRALGSQEQFKDFASAQRWLEQMNPRPGASVDYFPILVKDAGRKLYPEAA